MNKAFIFCLACLFLTLSVKSQTDNNTATIVIEATIVDSKTGEKIPFAHIYHAKTNQGTASNVNGFFRMPNLSLKDSITVSFVGYGKQYFSVISTLNNKTISLIPKVHGLNEFAVLADNTFLYTLLSNARKTKHFNTKTAKTYFELKTNVEGRQVEMLECYFNGVFMGYDVEELNLKNGRIALAEFNKNLFISTETSKAISFHKLMGNNEYFPKSPLDVSKRKMKKLFDLSLVSSFTDENNKRIYAIAFSPKSEPTSSFSGTIWVDSTQAKVIKIKMDVKNADIYPIAPIKFTDTLDQVNMHLTKNFIDIDGHMYVQSIDFKYDMLYKNFYNERYVVSTTALLTAYNYQESFILPSFTFEKSEMHKDFKQITAVPYNAFFWNNITEFRINDILDKNEFFEKHYSPEGQEQLVSEANGGVNINMLYRGYIPWSNNRITLKDNIFLSPTAKLYQERVIASSNWLEIQTYFDVNTFNDSTHILTQTLYDPFQSFHKVHQLIKTQAFINIYFDLIEVQRRKFEQKINGSCADCSASEIVVHYQKLLRDNEALRKKYYRDVDRGNNARQFMEWNEFVKLKLGIDNWKFFEQLEK